MAGALVTCGKTGFRRTPFDVAIWFFFLWTVASSFLSAEPRISIAKIQSTCVFLLFYLTQAVVTRRTAVMLVAIMILVGRGRNSLQSLRSRAWSRRSDRIVSSGQSAADVDIREGDAIWRIGGRRVYSVADIDDAIRNAPPETELSVSLISQGEHLERPGLIVSEAVRKRPSPFGNYRQQADAPISRLWLDTPLRNLFGDSPDSCATRVRVGCGKLQEPPFESPRQTRFRGFRAAGAGHRVDRDADRFGALAIGVVVISLRALGSKSESSESCRSVSAAGVWRVRGLSNTRATCVVARRSEFLVAGSGRGDRPVADDASSRLRTRHGLDARALERSGVSRKDMLHLHSTPLQLAFDRGLPALIFWLWIMWLFWRSAARGEKSLRDSSDTNRYGLLLGATGAVAGFFASSLVNYNFGDGEVALVFWWLMGIVVVLPTILDVITRKQNELRTYENLSDSFSQLHLRSFCCCLVFCASTACRHFSDAAEVDAKCAAR